MKRMREEMGQGEYLHWAAYHSHRVQREEMAAKKAKAR